MQNLPQKLAWADCQCGHSSCKRSHPVNIGTFYQGTGFDPHERAALDRAWSLLMSEKKEAA